MIFSGIILLGNGLPFHSDPQRLHSQRGTDRSHLCLYPGLPKAFPSIAMMEHQQAVAAVIRQNPQRGKFLLDRGSQRFHHPATPALPSCILKPRSQRKYSADQVIDQLRPKLANDPRDQVLFCRTFPPIQIGGTP